MSASLPTTALTPEFADAVRTHIAARQEAGVTLLGQLVRTESPSSDSSAVTRAGGVLREALEVLHFDVHALPSNSGGAIYARPVHRQRGRPIQLLLGHLDTVWPIGTIERLPFDVREGRVRGPGVFDMKAGLVQLILALDAVHALGLNLPAEPVVFVNGDEEIGSTDSERWIRRLAGIAARAFVLEPALGLEGSLKTARKGIGRFHVIVRGKAAHAGLDPEGGASAILELANVVHKLHALSDPTAGVSVNVGMIEGGVRPNVVAPDARAVVDVRVPTAAAAARVKQAILAITAETPGTTVEITGEIGRPPMEATARNQRLWAQAKEAGRLLGLDLSEAAAGGGSDGNTTSLFTATLDGLGAVGDGAHAEHEFAYIDYIPERAALLALLLVSPLETPAP